MALSRIGSGANKPAPKIEPVPPITLLFWDDVVIVCDNGRASVGQYKMLCDLVIERSEQHPRLGMLSIVARDAVPPNDEARRAMNDALTRVERCLRCLCWLVEGDGFQGAMVRAVLTGIRVFGKHPYPMHVTAEMPEAVSWIFQQLDGGPKRLPQVGAAIGQIQQRRKNGTFDGAF